MNELSQNEMNEIEALFQVPPEGPRAMTHRQREQDALCQPGAVIRALVGFPTATGTDFGAVSDVRITSRDADGRTAYGIVEGPAHIGTQVVVDVFEFSVRVA